MLRPINLVHMVINTPSAIHHRGKQFRFLLVGAVEIFARQFVLRRLLQMPLAVGNKIIDLLQVLLKRHVHRRGAGQMHVS